MSSLNRPDLGVMRADLAHAQACGAVDCPAECEVIVDDHAPTLLAYAERLEAEVERLRGLVRGGFVEALDLACDHSLTTKDHNLLWRDSDTRAALNEQEKTDD